MAIKFERIKSGMVLWDVRKAVKLVSGGSKWYCFPVFIKEVDAANREVLASWNGEPADWVHESRVTKYRANKPKD